MKSREMELLRLLENISETTITPSRDTYSSYDCESDKAIIELKVRDSYYPTKMIELDKMVRCLDIAKEVGKDFVYVVQDPKGIYYSNISKECNSILSTPAKKILCPKTTEFSNNNKIEKLVYNINMTKIC